MLWGVVGIALGVFVGATIVMLVIVIPENRRIRAANKAGIRAREDEIREREAFYLSQPAIDQVKLPPGVKIVYGLGTSSFAKGEPHDAAHASQLPFLTDKQRQSREFKEWLEHRP